MLKKRWAFLRKLFGTLFWIPVCVFGYFGRVFHRGNLFEFIASVLIVSAVLLLILWLFRLKPGALRAVKVLILGVFITSFFAQYKFFNNPVCTEELPDQFTAVFTTEECANSALTDRELCELASANPFDIMIGGKHMFVTHGKNEAVTVHDYPVGQDRKFDFKVIGAGFRSRPQRMAMDDKRKKLYITNYGKKRDLIHVDIKNAKSEFMDIDGCESSIDVAIDNAKNRLWILCEGSRTIIVYDLVEKMNIKKMFTLDLGFTVGLPYSIAINEKTRKVYVTHWVGTRMLQIDADTFKLVRIKRIGISAFKVLIDEDKNLIYVARPLASDVVVLDGKDLSVKKRLDFGKGIRDIELLPKHGLLAGGGYIDGIFGIVDVKSGKVIGKFKLGTLIRGTFYDDQTETIWIASGCGIYSIALKTLCADL